VLSAALQQANAEKAVLAADKARLEQEIARLRLQASVMGKALSMAPNGHRDATSAPTESSLVLVGLLGSSLPPPKWHLRVFQ
jgi:hypothetical protein